MTNRRRLPPASGSCLRHGLRSLARLPPRRRTGGDCLRAHDGPGRWRTSPTRRPSRRCASAGHRADRRHDRHRRRGARRGADALHRREGRARGAKRVGRARLPNVDIAVDPLEGTNLCATGRAERDRRARGVEQRRTAARARSLHGEAGRRPELEGRRQPRRDRGRQSGRHRQVASTATSRTSSSSCSTGRVTSS